MTDGGGEAVGCALPDGDGDGGGGVGSGDGGADAVGRAVVDGDGDTGAGVTDGDGSGVRGGVGAGVGARVGTAVAVGAGVGGEVGAVVAVGGRVGVGVRLGNGVGGTEATERFNSTVAPSRHVAVSAARAPPTVKVTVAPSVPQPACEVAGFTSSTYVPPALTCAAPQVALPMVATTAVPAAAGCPLSCAVPERRIGSV